MPTIKHDIFSILNTFSGQFSRKAAFVWFVVVIFGFLCRFDHYGVSSFVRWLGLMPNTYPLLIHFFHAKSWSLSKLMIQWIKWNLKVHSLVKVNDRLLCLGDGIKIPKEAQKQVGIKRMHNNSGNSSKPEKFMGHHIGCIAFVAQKCSKYFGLLQVAQIHEGVDELQKLGGENTEKQTVVTRMVNLIIIVAISTQTPVYACLDALFATAPAFNLASQYLMVNGQPWVHIISRAKSSYVGYTNKTKSKKYKIKLWDLFNQSDLFTKVPHPIHEKREISYYHKNLYWGTVTGLISFVWVIDGKHHFVLMSSDVTMHPLDTLRCYALRSKIEVAFLWLKHLIGGFNYRFWSKSWLKPSRKKKEVILPLSTDKKRAEKGLQNLMAIERFVNLAIIALGILQYVAITHTAIIWRIHKATSWLRTYSSEIPSEEVVQRALQAEIIIRSNQSCYSGIKAQVAYSAFPNNASKVPKNDTLRCFLLS